MRKTILAAAAVLLAASAAHADIRHYLVAQWYDSGAHFCRYDNGTVLNVGYRVCPISI